MPTIFFEEIECYNPRGSHDDVRLSAACDGHGRRTIWGPERMHEGNVIDLTGRSESVEYFDTASIRLNGDLGYDFGSMQFDHHSEAGTGEFYFPGDLNARYRVSFRVDPQPTSSTRGLIRLVRLTCNDAQGTHDEVTLRVNGVYILNRHEMKTGWQVNFEDEIPFNHACTIILSETYLQDWSKSFTLRVGEYELGDDHHEFVMDSGRTGDARYTLEYEMVE